MRQGEHQRTADSVSFGSTLVCRSGPIKTHERILAAALRLFNESGTAAISTNHIAEACGISPGNLYYHFRNKEAIIRALFEQQFARWDQMYEMPTDRFPTVDDLQGLLRASFRTGWEYRFIYRELIALLRRDDELHQRWIAIRAASACFRPSSSIRTSCASRAPTC